MKPHDEIILLTMSSIVLGVFTFIISINLMPNHNFGINQLLGMAGNRSDERHTFNVNDRNDPLQAHILEINLTDTNLEIKVSEEIISYCIKTTRSTPGKRSLCWSNTNHNIIKTPILRGRTYYIWIKDTNNFISTPRSVKI